MADPEHTVARLLRAARAYSGKSRVQIGDIVGVNEGTIGRWERGNWKKDAPNLLFVKAIASAVDLDALARDIEALDRPDAFTRFSTRVQEAVQQPPEHPSSEPGDQAGEGDAG